MKNKRSFFRNHLYEFIVFAIFTVIAAIIFLIHQLAGVIAFAGVISYAVIILIFANLRRTRVIRDRNGNAISQLVAALVEKMDSPVMVVNEENKIVWCNEEFSLLEEINEKQLDAGANKLFNGKVSYSNLLAAFQENNVFVIVESNGAFYEVHIHPIEYGRHSLFATVWYSINNEKNLKKKLDDSALRVAYIVIDNTNEVTQEVQENGRFGSATVNKLLTEWASAFDAILTEYDRDKYVMQFENRYLQEMINSKFDIIDKIVESSLEISSVPITISIGVSIGEGTLSERRESAQAALRSALQRGGALAVVRTPDGEDSYGGRTKAVQRQTKIRSRLCRDLLLDQLTKCSNVIIMGHSRPDFDSIASNIGISKLAQMLGKDFCIVADKNDKSISKIIDLISGFPEYESVFVDPVFAQELLSPETLVIITDASNPELFSARNVYENASKVVVIDHHAIKETLGSQVLQQSNIDPTASSASELVCEILELTINASALRPEEAQALLAGILLDTQFFARDTGTRTYAACSYLKSAGAETSKAKNLFKSDIKQFRVVSKIERQMEVYLDKFVISYYVDDTDPENKVSASMAADRMVEIDGINASFVLYSLDNGINLSARSDGSINVINIAKMLGGGGHFQSAGALIRKIDGDEFGNAVEDLDEAVTILKRAIEEYVGGATKEGK